MYEDVSARLKIQHLIPFFSTLKHKVSNRNRWRRRDFSLGKRIRAHLYSRQIGKAWSHFYRRRENKPRVLEYCTDFFVPSEFCERWSFKKPEKQQIELHRRYSFSQTLTGALGSTVYVHFLGSLPRYVVWTTVIGTSDLDAPSTKCLLNSKFLLLSFRIHPYSRGFYQELNGLGKHAGPGCLTNTYKLYTKEKISKRDKL